MAPEVIQYDLPKVVLCINVLKVSINVFKVSMRLIFSFYDKLSLVLAVHLVHEYRLLCTPHKMGKISQLLQTSEISVYGFS